LTYLLHTVGLVGLLGLGRSLVLALRGIRLGLGFRVRVLALAALLLGLSLLGNLVLRRGFVTGLGFGLRLGLGLRLRFRFRLGSGFGLGLGRRLLGVLCLLDWLLLFALTLAAGGAGVLHLLIAVGLGLGAARRRLLLLLLELCLLLLGDELASDFLALGLRTLSRLGDSGILDLGKGLVDGLFGALCGLRLGLGHFALHFLLVKRRVYELGEAHTKYNIPQCNEMDCWSREADLSMCGRAYFPTTPDLKRIK